MPGGTPNSPKLALRLAAAPAMMYTKTRGLLPAPEVILSAMVEGGCFFRGISGDQARPAGNIEVLAVQSM